MTSKNDFMQSMLDAAIDAARKEGYEAGVNAEIANSESEFWRGHELGYDEGYSAGLDAGWDQGRL